MRAVVAASATFFSDVRGRRVLAIIIYRGPAKPLSLRLCRFAKLSGAMLIPFNPHHAAPKRERRAVIHWCCRRRLGSPV
jgi:hypothetical protein